eukprot:TRINITY_DN21571_c0_g1_i1.p1 TRINITY_DN21571_c0_g1~~TRINITY_DN21571_c0_g1_i1.p1  ORF type:complete len:201 (-),score=38.56 TRINITY_DN21571_c0_g1_i1:23-565(-)
MDCSEFSQIDTPRYAPVYLLHLHQYTFGESISNDLREKREHWIVVVDIDRQTNEQQIIGLEIHILWEEQKSNNLVLAPIRRGTFDKARIPSYEYVGDIENVGNLPSMHWAYELHRFALKVFWEMTTELGKDWGANVNCQQFGRLYLRKLSLKYDGVACGDNHQVAIDCFCSLDKWRRNCK